jgi:hypothetical protein
MYCLVFYKDTKVFLLKKDIKMLKKIKYFTKKFVYEDKMCLYLSRDFEN